MKEFGPSGFCNARALTSAIPPAALERIGEDFLWIWCV